MAIEQTLLPGTDMMVSNLVQGTMAIDKLGEAGAHALLDGVLGLGCTTFDTAHVYGGGENERIFGRWLRSRDIRDDVVVIGKGGEPGPDGSRVSPDHLTADLHDSLDRLGIDHVDLYLVHVDDPATPVEPIVDVLAEHAAAGLFTRYGVSNWSCERIEAAQAYARAAGLPALSASSVHLSLASWREQPWPGTRSIAGDQHVDERTWYRKNGMPILAWSTLAGGFFSGRVTRRSAHRLTDYFDQVCASTYGSEENFRRFDRAEQLGVQLRATAAQVALAWVMAQPLRIGALVGSLDVAEFRACVDALELRLNPEQTHWLEHGEQ